MEVSRSDFRWFDIVWWVGRDGCWFIMWWLFLLFDVDVDCDDEVDVIYDDGVSYDEVILAVWLPWS